LTSSQSSPWTVASGAGGDALISVLLPFRDAASTLPRALASISAQSLTRFEVIAVDDGSADGSAAIVSAAAAGDGRIRLVRNPRPGLVNALNLGLRECVAEFVARMDADDIAASRRLEIQAEWLRTTPWTSVVGSRVRPFPAGRLTDGFRRYVEWQNGCVTPEEITDNLYVESPLAHPSVMFRRSVVRAHGTYRAGPFPEDYELWLRLSAAGERLSKIGKTLLLWREHPRRASRTDPRYSDAAFARLRAEYLHRDSRLREAKHGIAIWGAGRVTRRRVEYLLSLGVEPRRWIDIDPRKIGNRIRGVAVESPQWLDRPDPPFVLVYARAHGARELTSAFLERLGYVCGKNYLAVG